MKTILEDLYSKLGIRLIAGLLITTVSGLIEGALFFSIYPIVCKAVGANIDLSSYLQTSFYLDGVLNLLLEHYLILFFGFAVLYAGVYFIQVKYLSLLHSDYLKIWRSQLIDQVVSSDWHSVKALGDAKVIGTITEFLPKLDLMLFHLIETVVGATQICIYLTLAMFISYKITIFMAFAGCFLLAIFSPLLVKLSKISSNIYNQAALLSQQVSNTIQSLKLIKATNAETFIKHKFETLNEALTRVTMRGYVNSSYVNILFQLGTVILLVCMLELSMRVAQVSTASILFILALYTRIYPKYVLVSNQLYLTKTNAKALDKILELSQALLIKKFSFVEHKELSSLRKLQLSNIVASYSDDQPIQLKSFVLYKNEFCVIRGRSGSGKTTLAEALLGLCPMSAGAIYWNECRLAPSDLKALRDKVSYVTQEDYFFRGSIRDNLSWNNESINRDDMDSALKQAGIYDYIQSLPKKYEYELYDGAANLSGGQRQRLAIARALLKPHCELLILDESTSALDEYNERLLLTTLGNLKRQMAVLLITHKCMADEFADRIYNLNNGRLFDITHQAVQGP